MTIFQQLYRHATRHRFLQRIRPFWRSRSRDGGDNLNLIFKVLKRGDKLEKALASGSEKELSDMGLRYDLTLPLSRYYAANREQLPAPFKVIQTDRVYRAERPQKGRLREFVQCDIDILGDESSQCRGGAD